MVSVERAKPLTLPCLEAKGLWGRKQAKEKLKKGGEPPNYNLIEKFLTEKEKVREDRQESKVLHERKLSLEECKIANEEKKTL